MAGPGDEIAGAGNHSHLRASHADREHVIDVLKAAFVQGMLAKDELDQRIGQALASRTHADLAALTTDIPAERTGAQPPPEAARESDNKKRVKAAAWVTAVPSMAVIAAGMASAGVTAVSLFAVVLYLSVVTLSVTGLLTGLLWIEKRPTRQSSPGPPPSAGGQAAQHLAPADPAGQLPQISHDPRHTAEAAVPGRRQANQCRSWPCGQS